jgi:hypothetical protein
LNGAREVFTLKTEPSRGHAQKPDSLLSSKGLGRSAETNQETHGGSPPPPGKLFFNYWEKSLDFLRNGRKLARQGKIF